MNPIIHAFRYSSNIKTFLPIGGQITRFKKSSASSTSNSGSDDEIKKQKPKPSKGNEAALNKLNDLLLKMVNEEPTVAPTKINLAKPVDKRKSTKTKNEAEAASKLTEKIETPQEKILKAVKNVASTIGGDVNKVESELLSKLLNTEEIKTESLSDLMKNMKVEKDESADQTRSQEVKRILQSTGRTHQRARTQYRPKDRSQTAAPVYKKIDLFGAEPLRIFPKGAPAHEGVKTHTWDYLTQHELKLATRQPPRTYFQQMAQWTEQGKVWRFPIDNEQGLERERQVYFAEHVFLERHLEGWCPQRGPLRHFMELVCVGLSKNPYLTVEAKREHIEWFRNYFEEKKQLLQEVGALQEKKAEQTVKEIGLE